MGSLSKAVYTLFWTVLIVYVTIGAFNFFGVGFNVYGIYLMWFMCLIMLSIFLPVRVGAIFDG